MQLHTVNVIISEAPKLALYHAGCIHNSPRSVTSCCEHNTLYGK